MLGRRHKVKLKEIARRIENTQDIRDSIVDTSHEATKEIEQLLCQFDESLKKKSSLTTELALFNSTNELAEFLSSLMDDISERGEEFRNFSSGGTSGDPDPSEDRHHIDNDSVAEPNWVKKLKREISKACHPDKLESMELSPHEKWKRSQYLLALNDALGQQEWDYVLLIGVQLDIYTEELPPMNQKRRLNKAFGKLNSQVAELRKSIAYKWSEDWGNTELKWQIVQFFLEQKGKPIPDKLESIKIIKEFEKKLEM
jgi:hypothetical protein